MAITAKQVKELREKTGAGMMDCKKALTETDGDLNKAIDWLREKGIAKSQKKADRIAAEGLTRVAVEGNTAVIFEINSETDFVAKNDKFLNLFDVVQKLLIDNKPADVEAALALPVEDGTLNDLIINATATIGEKISFRRFAIVEKSDDQFFGSYMHMGGTISSVVVLGGKEDATVAKNMAMQVASMSPLYAREADIPASELEHETNLQRQMMEQDPKMAGKPEKVLAGILTGKVKKHFKELCLEDQEFFLESKKAVSQYLKENGAEVVSFIRYQVGEGMEKREENFAEEVAAQMKG